jgi:ketosteroid isomerase-like protein
MRLKKASYLLAGITTSMMVPLLIARIASADTHPGQNSGSKPTAESALAAEEALAKAMRENDADGIARMLSDDWAVVNARGGVGEGKDVFPSGIREGVLKRTTYEISEQRVRVEGTTAVVTVKLHLTGVFSGKAFDVMERSSDVFVWKDGAWKAILTHETFIPPTAPT